MPGAGFGRPVGDTSGCDRWVGWEVAAGGRRRVRLGAEASAMSAELGGSARPRRPIAAAAGTLTGLALAGNTLAISVWRGTRAAGAGRSATPPSGSVTTPGGRRARRHRAGSRPRGLPRRRRAPSRPRSAPRLRLRRRSRPPPAPPLTPADAVLLVTVGLARVERGPVDLVELAIQLPAAGPSTTSAVLRPAGPSVGSARSARPWSGRHGEDVGDGLPILERRSARRGSRTVNVNRPSVLDPGDLG